MKKDDQTSLVEWYVTVCTASLGQLRKMLLDRIARGAFDESDAAFLEDGFRDVILDTHQLEIAAAMDERPPPKDFN